MFKTCEDSEFALIYFKSVSINNILVKLMLSKKQLQSAVKSQFDERSRFFHLVELGHDRLLMGHVIAGYVRGQGL